MPRRELGAAVDAAGETWSEPKRRSGSCRAPFDFSRSGRGIGRGPRWSVHRRRRRAVRRGPKVLELMHIFYGGSPIHCPGAGVLKSRRTSGARGVKCPISPPRTPTTESATIRPIAIRTGGRAAEGDGLLNRYTGYHPVSRVRIPTCPLPNPTHASAWVAVFLGRGEQRGRAAQTVAFQGFPLVTPGYRRSPRWGEVWCSGIARGMTRSSNRRTARAGGAVRRSVSGHERVQFGVGCVLIRACRRRRHLRLPVR